MRLQEGAVIDNDAPLLSNTRGTVAFAAVGGGGGGGGDVVVVDDDDDDAGAGGVGFACRR